MAVAWAGGGGGVQCGCIWLIGGGGGVYIGLLSTLFCFFL